MSDLRADLVARLLARVQAWEATMPPVAPHPSLDVEAGRLDAALDSFADRLTGSYPFFHPRYAGQMLKPPHPVALAAYAATAAINPNNHALDGGPATSEMEREAVAALAAMVGFPATCLGHLTSGGTVANLDALFLAREAASASGRPGGVVLHSAAAHYTHARMAHVLGLASEAVPTDADGRMDVDALDARLARGGVCVVVATAGTTGLGRVDPIADIATVARRHGVRLHVDAAYGGFFVLLARDPESDGGRLLGPETARHLAAVAQSDTVVLDPHKHGLQPYGCGALLVRDPHEARFYAHDSPYTYYSGGLAGSGAHLGETTLECSRAGASAAALWLTLAALPLDARSGFGPVLAACLRAARRWQEAVTASEHLRAIGAPELDIVAYHPRSLSATGVDAASAALFEAAAARHLHLALFTVPGDRLPGVAADAPTVRVLRSVLIKPEHELHGPALVAELDRLAGSLGAVADGRNQA